MSLRAELRAERGGGVAISRNDEKRVSLRAEALSVAKGEGVAISVVGHSWGLLRPSTEGLAKTKRGGMCVTYHIDEHRNLTIKFV